LAAQVWTGIRSGSDPIGSRRAAQAIEGGVRAALVILTAALALDTEAGVDPAAAG